MDIDIGRIGRMMPSLDSDLSWIYRLLLNVIGYASFIVPIVALAKYLEKSNYFSQKGRLSRTQHFVRLLFVGNKTIEPITTAPAAGESDAANNTGLMRLLFCMVGLEGAYLCWGVVQEKIMTQVYSAEGAADVKFTDSQFLVLANRIFAIGFGGCFIVYKYSSQPIHRAPLYKYAFASLSNILSSWCQYEALKFISFPTQVLGKASKIIPVMLMGKLVQNKTYPLNQYLTSGLISVGIGLFLFSRGQESSKLAQTTTFSGLILMFGYLFFDSFTGNWQNRLFKEYGLSSWQMMVGVCTWSAMLTAVSELEQGGIGEAITFMFDYPVFLFDLLLMSTCSAVGQMFIFFTIQSFGVVTFTILMTMRQAIAIVLSCLIYGHVIRPEGLIGIVVVFIALGLRSYFSHRDQKRLSLAGTKM